MNHFVVERQFLIIVMIAFLLSTIFVFGTDINTRRLRLCNLNADSYLDSIRLDSDNNLSHIVWGDSLSQEVHKTFFKYPKDSLIKCKYSLINFDIDSLKDIYINIKYRYGNFDSTYHYVILAQESLHLIDTIRLDTNTIFPSNIVGYTGLDSVFTGSTLFTPGSMKALTFRRVTRNIVVPAIQTTVENTNLFKEQQIDIYPTPSSDHLIFKLSGFSSGFYNCEIVNLLNQPVLRDKIFVSGTLFSKEINLQSLTSGIYSFKIYNDTLVLNKLVIIIK
jgi:hypothetical protein